MASTSGRRVIVPLVNRSGGAVAAGDVVVIGDGTNNSCFTTTTTASFNARHIGIAQETIASLATGRVLLRGYASIVNTNASVTRDHFLFTHTVAKEATGSATRAAGAFGQVLATGADPAALIWGMPDAVGTGAGVFSGARAYASAVQSILNSTDTAVTFNTEEYDTDAIHDTSSNTSRFTKPSGKTKARITVNVAFAASSTGIRFIYLRTDGVAEVRGTRAVENAPHASNLTLLHMDATIDVTSIGYIEVMAHQSTGGAANIGHASLDQVRNAMSVEWT